MRKLIILTLLLLTIIFSGCIKNQIREVSETTIPITSLTTTPTTTIIPLTQDISISHVGFAKTQKHAVFIIRNTGQLPIKEITIFIDDEEDKKILGYLGSGKAIQETIYLESGEHRIEVRTKEGTNDSVNVNIS